MKNPSQQFLRLYDELSLVFELGWHKDVGIAVPSDGFDPKIAKLYHTGQDTNELVNRFIYEGDRASIPEEFQGPVIIVRGPLGEPQAFEMTFDGEVPYEGELPANFESAHWNIATSHFRGSYGAEESRDFEMNYTFAKDMDLDFDVYTGDWNSEPDPVTPEDTPASSVDDFISLSNADYKAPMAGRFVVVFSEFDDEVREIYIESLHKKETPSVTVGSSDPVDMFDIEAKRDLSAISIPRPENYEDVAPNCRIELPPYDHLKAIVDLWGAESFLTITPVDDRLVIAPIAQARRMAPPKARKFPQVLFAIGALACALAALYLNVSGEARATDPVSELRQQMFE